MNNDKKLTVIIPTTAETIRAVSLDKAIQSIKQQVYIQATILLIVNGDIFDKDLFNSLKKRNDIKTLYLAEGSLPKAISFGVLNVNTPFFCFLDDDDCYIPDTLYQRLKPMTDDSTISFVVSMGFRCSDRIEELIPKIFPVSYANAASLILHENWLASCGGLYRKSPGITQCFQNIPKYAEWTYIGFMLATTNKGFFLPIPVFKIYDSNVSLSKNSKYKLGLLDCTKRIIEISPKNLKLQVKIKYGKALHDLSSDYLSHEDTLNSIKLHFLSLLQPKGYLYLFYSRHILKRILIELHL